MDPNATLTELRKIVRDYRDNSTALDELPAGRHDRWTELMDERLTLAERLVDRVEALDEWFRDGGYVPAAWRKGDPVKPVSTD